MSKWDDTYDELSDDELAELQDRLNGELTDDEIEAMYAVRCWSDLD